MPARSEFNVSSSWVQGAIILPVALAAEPIVSAFALDEPDFLVILTQSCDIVHESLEDEPHIELLVARRIPDIDGNYTFGKNPRTFDFQHDAFSYRCHVREKVVLPRTVLVGRDPAACISLDTVLQLGRWAGKRYTRPAFPDEFNRRRSPALAKIRKILTRGGVNITGIYFSLDTNEELSSADPYRLIIYVTVEPSTTEDVSVLAVAASAAAELHEAMNGCENIEVLETAVKSEIEVSLFDLRYLLRADFDYVSARSGGGIVAE